MNFGFLEEILFTNIEEKGSAEHPIHPAPFATPSRIILNIYAQITEYYS